MNHRRKTGITIIVCVFVCLLGLMGSFAGSLRYGLRDEAIETLATEWELSQMQITKIADRMSMAQFFVVMVQTPGIEEQGAINLLDAAYTRSFIAEKIRDYRDDLLKKTGEGRISFEDIAELEETYRDEVCRDLQYNVTADDMERYGIVWDNLALGEKFVLEEYRSERPGMFGFVSVILSGWFLALSVLLIAGAGVGLWFLNGHSFELHGIYGAVLLILGILDCVLSASCGLLADAINRIVNMRSNVMGLFFSPVGNMLLILGLASALLGVVVIAVSALTKKRMRRRRRRKSIARKP